jgi:hypothetical protein
MSPRRPEVKARREIDDALAASGWAVQDYEEMNLSASRGVAVREFVRAPAHGSADYLLFVDGRPVGTLEAKPSQLRAKTFQRFLHARASSPRSLGSSSAGVHECAFGLLRFARSCLHRQGDLEARLPTFGAATR